MTSVRLMIVGRIVCLREGQQLAHEHGRAIGVALDLHQVGKACVGRTRLQQQMVGRQQDRGQHVVEIVGDAAGKHAHRIHLLRLRHLRLERLLLRHLDGVDDGSLFRRLVALLDDRIDIEAEMPCLILRVAGIDRRNIALPVLGSGKCLRQQRPLAFAEDRLQRRAALDIVARNHVGKQLQERCVGAKDTPCPVDGSNRHRRIVEKAGEAHRRNRGRLVVVIIFLAAEHDRPAFAGGTVTHGGDAVHQTRWQALAVALAQVEIEGDGLLQAGFRLHGLDEREPSPATRSPTVIDPGVNLVRSSPSHSASVALR